MARAYVGDQRECETHFIMCDDHGWRGWLMILDSISNRAGLGSCGFMFGIEERQQPK